MIKRSYLQNAKAQAFDEFLIEKFKSIEDHKEGSEEAARFFYYCQKIKNL
jgi:hypothetical protein